MTTSKIVYFVTCSLMMIGPIPAAVAGPMHARAAICALNGCTASADCEPHSGAAHATKTASTAAGTISVTAHEQLGNNYVRISNPAVYLGWSASGHAHHHAVGCIPIAPNGINGAENSEESAVVSDNLFANQTYGPGPNSNTIAVGFDSSSFLQLNLSNPAVMTTGWIMEINGTESSVVLHGLSGASNDSVWAETTGLFAGRQYTISSSPGHVHTLRFVSPLQWTVAGVWDTADIGLEASVCAGASMCTAEAVPVPAAPLAGILGMGSFLVLIGVTRLRRGFAGRGD